MLPLVFYCTWKGQRRFPVLGEFIVPLGENSPGSGDGLHGLENVPYSKTAKALCVCQSADHPLQPCSAGIFVTIPV